MAKMGHCKHGEFPLMDGCKECIAERRAAGIRPEQDELEDGLNSEGLTLAEPDKQIVKVRYFSETTGEVSAREYTYYSADPLSVGDIVTVPVRDTTGKAKVSAIDVAETEIASFKDKVKTIPTGSVVIDKTIEQMEQEADESLVATEKQWEAEAEAKLAERDDLLIETPTALVKVKPEADVQVMAFYNEAVSLRQYAEARVILTNDDLKPANDDLILIRKVKKAMEEKRKEYLKPFQDHVKETNDAYKMLMEPVEQADKITAGKMLAFDAEQKRKIREAEAIEAEKLALARREAELKGGEITVDLTPIEKPEAPPDRIRTEMGSTGQRDHWTFEVMDFALLPDEYKMPDASKIGKVVRAGLHKIPGVKIWNELIIAYRS